MAQSNYDAIAAEMSRRHADTAAWIRSLNLSEMAGQDEFFEQLVELEIGFAELLVSQKEDLSDLSLSDAARDVLWPHIQQMQNMDPSTFNNSNNNNNNSSNNQLDQFLNQLLSNSQGGNSRAATVGSSQQGEGENGNQGEGQQGQQQGQSSQQAPLPGANNNNNNNANDNKEDETTKLKKWCKNNKIDEKVGELLQNDGLTLQELGTYDEDDILEWCKINGIKIAQRKRLVLAVGVIPKAHQVVRVRLTAEEANTLDEFKVMSQHCERSIEKIAEFKTNSQTNATNAETQINTICDKLLETVNSLRSTAVSKTKEIATQHTLKLNETTETFTNILSSIKDTEKNIMILLIIDHIKIIQQKKLKMKKSQ